MAITAKKIKSKFGESRFTEPETSLMIEQDCECCNCGCNVLESDGMPDIKDGDLYCEECHTEEFMITCPICEDYFEKPETAENTRFVINKEAAKELAVVPGIYKALRYPIYYGATGYGVEGLFTENVELIRKLDIEKVVSDLRFVHSNRRKKVEIASDHICEECFQKYTLQKRFYAQFHKNSLSLNINIRGILAAAK